MRPTVENLLFNPTMTNKHIDVLKTPVTRSRSLISGAMFMGLKEAMQLKPIMKSKRNTVILHDLPEQIPQEDTNSAWCFFVSFFVGSFSFGFGSMLHKVGLAGALGVESEVIKDMRRF